MSNRVSNLDLLHGIKIIYEDEFWFVIDKPAGMMSQGGKPGLENVVDVLKNYRKQCERKVDHPFVAAVQRLDTNVSGVMVLAKRSKSANRFREQLKTGEVVKKYVALLPLTQNPIGADQSWLNRGVKIQQKLRLYSYFERFTGPTLDCRLSVSPLQNTGQFQWVSIHLLTGSFHQIRAQCAWRGMPIVGDQKYGSVVPAHRIMLHASEVSFKLRPNEPPQTLCSRKGHRDLLKKT